MSRFLNFCTLNLDTGLVKTSAGLSSEGTFNSIQILYSSHLGEGIFVYSDVSKLFF